MRPSLVFEPRDYAPEFRFALQLPGAVGRFGERPAQRWCNMPLSNLDQLKTAEHLRRQATSYRALARRVTDEHAVPAVG